MQRHRFLVGCAITGTVLLVAPVDPVRAQASSDDRQCIESINRAVGKVARAENDMLGRCVGAFAKGVLAQPTIAACAAPANATKVQTAVAKALSESAQRCHGVPPSFGPPNTTAFPGLAVQASVNVLEDAFGPTVEDTLSTVAPEATCQRAALLSAHKCQKTRLDAFEKCKKTGLQNGSISDAADLAAACLGTGPSQPDPTGKIQRTCVEKAAQEITKGCAGSGVALEQLVPGCGSTDAGVTAQCVDRVVRCRTCELLNAADGLLRDCDLFDDGNAQNATCSTCGDDVIGGLESCEDGNQAGGDGCGVCQIEVGWSCAGEPSVCTTTCGDGIPVGAEGCDDGNLTSGDGCDGACQVESGHVCVGVPSVCTAITVYYVDVLLGDDGNTGSPSAPFATIQRAADLVNPGDTVIVRDGVYTDTNGDTVVAYLRRPGSAGYVVTYKAEHPGGAILDGLGNAADHGFFLEAPTAHVRIEGFEVRGTKSHGVFFDAGVTDVVVVGNAFHDIGRYCTDTTFGRDGSFLRSGVARITFERNTFHDIGRFENGENGCINGNNYYQNHDHGIYVSGADDVVIKNNVFHSLRRGWAIQVFGGDATERLRVLNNTFAFESPYRDGHIVLASTVVDAAIENNVFYDPRAVAVTYSGGSYTNCFIRRNIVYSGTASNVPPTGMTVLDNLDNTDPLLANPAGFDFHLTMSSPAVDAGNALAQVADDFDGTSRPQGSGFDLGAFELGP